MQGLDADRWCGLILRAKPLEADRTLEALKLTSDGDNLATSFCGVPPRFLLVSKPRAEHRRLVLKTCIATNALVASTGPYQNDSSEVYKH